MSAYKSTEFVNESDSDVSDQEYEPPKHYKKFKPSSSFKVQDNKEMWLLKVPKGLPLEDLKSLPISFTGNPIDASSVSFKAGDRMYRVNEQLFSTSTDNGKYTVLSTKDKDVYKAENKNIERFYNICETVQIPEIDYSRAVKKRKDVRKIKNLKTRHFATGYSASDPNGSGTDAEASDNDGSDDSVDGLDGEKEKLTEKTKTGTSPSKHKHSSSKMDPSEKKEKKDKKDKKEKKVSKDKGEKKEKKHKKEKKVSKDKN